MAIWRIHDFIPSWKGPDISKRTSWTADSGNYTAKKVQYLGACGKDEGTMTVSIAAQMWIKTGPGNPTTWDTLNDTLTVEIEAPKVSLTIASQFDATLPAWPFWFGPTSGQGDSKTPTRTGRN